MSEGLEFALRTGLIGVSATLILDIWSLFLKFAFRGPSPNFALVGRWIGHMARGRLAHASMGEAPAIAGENAIGWIVHYGVGILYAALLVAVYGFEWLVAPTLLPALMAGVATVVAPFFIMQPAMGLGVASSKAPNPNIARLRTLAAHTVFGIGLYLSAVSVAFAW
jgi:hypothetical protein